MYDFPGRDFLCSYRTPDDTLQKIIVQAISDFASRVFVINHQSEFVKMLSPDGIVTLETMMYLADRSAKDTIERAGVG